MNYPYISIVKVCCPPCDNVDYWRQLVGDLSILMLPCHDPPGYSLFLVSENV
jgi:hypothetical protein